MELKDALEVLNNHSLSLSGKMISKPKQKEIIEAISIVIYKLKENCSIKN